ncbi:hypothetical protein MJG53_019332 [Ovis ammon polii x Ovis aries]|uniref:Uncharacterized protein n=1 Tax=Ovis ammon polii x Ovis aries TaxID=2918886 RepID=A0ACB9U363_9CETA|nr:hypothetical protein MJG53_019332 [Ovis ammon polii x Ovis aries]
MASSGSSGTSSVTANTASARVSPAKPGSLPLASSWKEIWEQPHGDVSMACPLPPPDGWKHAAVDRSGVVVFTVGPVATGSRRRRLVLRLSQKDALQALFQQNPYPGIATRERLARELGIAESRVQDQPTGSPRAEKRLLLQSGDVRRKRLGADTAARLLTTHLSFSLDSLGA